METNSNEKKKLTPEQMAKRKKINGIILACIGVIALIYGVAIFNADIPEPEEYNVAIVHNSDWDDSVKQVEDYIKANLNDPDSYKSVKWYKVVQHPETKGFQVRHTYRAKNVFGGVMTMDQLFFMDSLGIVLTVQDWN